MKGMIYSSTATEGKCLGITAKRPLSEESAFAWEPLVHTVHFFNL